MTKKKNEEKFISDYITSIGQFEKGKFNLISSACGSGKTELCTKKLWDIFPYPKERVLFVTSRALIADQLASQDDIERLYEKDYDLTRIWNGAYNGYVPEAYCGGPFRVMTYDMLAIILVEMGSFKKQALEAIDLVIVDECHCLFVDSYIKNVDVINFWLRETVVKGDKYVIGLTATPEIVIDAMERRNVPVRRVNNYVLVKYKAANLKCLDIDDAESLFCSDSLQGQTLVMCDTVSRCEHLCEIIPGAVMLVSRSSKKYTEEMDWIRRMIVRENRLPNWIPVVDQETGELTHRPLRVLVATSTIREGFSLKEKSNVRNIVSYYVDQMNIVQLLGRCRYDVDNLIIAGKGTGNGNNKHPYYLDYVEKYKEFLVGKNRKWFNSIKHVVNSSYEQIERSITAKEYRGKANAVNVKKFTKWLKQDYLSVKDPEDNTGKRWIKEVRINHKDDGPVIVEKAIEYRILSIVPSKYTLNKVMEFVEDTIGWKVTRGKSGGERYIYLTEK